MPIFGDWTADAELSPARGGNATVWRVTKDGQHFYALKQPHVQRADSEPYQRFIREVKTLDSLNGTRHVMPLLESHLPDRPSKSDPAYYVMPLMHPVSDAVARAEAHTVVAGVRDLAAMLAALWKERKLAHRDIKPENIFVNEGEWVLGDWGLVAHPEMPALTEPGGKIGPLWYIAPEALSACADADWSAADVYSLAKTLWVLLTGMRYPIPGTHLTFPEEFRRAYSLGTYCVLDRSRCDALDYAIERATAVDPSARPRMEWLAEELTIWLNPPGNGSARRPDLSDVLHQLRVETRQDALRAGLHEERRQQIAQLGAVVGRKLSTILGSLVRELGDGVQSGSGHGDLDLDGYLQDISRPGEHWKRDCFFNVGDWNATASLVGFIRLRLFADGTLYIEGGCYVIAFTKEGRKPRPIWRDCGLTSWGIPSQEATLDRLMRGLEGHLAEAVTLFADQRRAGRA